MHVVLLHVRAVGEPLLRGVLLQVIVLLVGVSVSGCAVCSLALFFVGRGAGGHACLFSVCSLALSFVGRGAGGHACLSLSRVGVTMARGSSLSFLLVGVLVAMQVCALSVPCSLFLLVGVLVAISDCALSVPVLSFFVGQGAGGHL